MSEEEQLNYIERQCQILNNKLRTKFNAGAICLMINEPSPDEIELYEEADDELAEALSQIEFRGAVVDNNSNNIISFVPYSELGIDPDDIGDEICVKNDKGEEICFSKEPDWERYIG